MYAASNKGEIYLFDLSILFSCYNIKMCQPESLRNNYNPYRGANEHFSNLMLKLDYTFCLSCKKFLAVPNIDEPHPSEI